MDNKKSVKKEGAKKYILVFECDDHEEFNSLKEVQDRVDELFRDGTIDVDEVTLYEVSKKFSLEVKTTFVSK